MKTKLSHLFTLVIGFLSIMFRHGHWRLAANEDAGKGSGLDPATGKTTDYRKMVMSLLGLQEDCDEGAMKNAFNTAMAFEPTGDDKAIQNKLSAATIKANEQATLAANLKTEKDNLELRVGDLVPKAAALLKRAELAEAAFANERNAHIETFIKFAVTTGRLSKAEGEAKTLELANAKTPAEYDGAVQAIANSRPKLSLTSTTLELERTIAPGTASGKYTQMVNEAMDKDPKKRGWEYHWNAVRQTPEGKSVFESMRKPEGNPLLQAKAA